MECTEVVNCHHSASSNTEAIISVQNLSKVYKLFDSHLDRLKESLNPFQKKYHTEFYALTDLTFDIKKGESVGIIGKNGSGKSTLLKILSGVLNPTTGSLSVNGKVSALLELGAGFNPDLSGIDNVYFNGMLMGYTHEQMNERLDSILSFADIGAFVYQPVKTYSSGMFVRLAFAVAVNVEPEILIVDEALSVGDVFFQQKCFKKMRSILESNVTLLFVSHDMGALQNLCERCILLKNGVKALDGAPVECVSAYYLPDERIIKASNEPTSVQIPRATKFFHKIDIIGNNLLSESCKEQGGKELEISAIDLLSQSGAGLQVKISEFIVLRVLLVANKFIAKPNVGISLFDRMGNLLFCTSAQQMNCTIAPMKPGEERIISIKIIMNVHIGDYTFNVGCSEQDPDDPNNSHVYHRWVDLGPIRVVANNECPLITGMVQLPCEIQNI